jgi:uncharacterized protein (TIGR03083 family)
VGVVRIDVTSSLAPEREALLATLRSLSREEWALPTECEAWDVKGIALHVLGDDLSLLARQRDDEPSGLLGYATDHPGLDFRGLLDGFNEQWVTAASFLAPRLVIELLTLTGEWSDGYYRGVDLDAPGEPVGWFGATGPTSPFWQAIAREYVERWVHHHQILRAVGRPPLDGPLAELVEHVALAGGAARLADLGAAPGDAVEVRMGERPWTLLRQADRWTLMPGAASAPRATVAVSSVEVAAVLTLGPNTAAETTVLSGDTALAASVAAALTP